MLEKHGKKHNYFYLLEPRNSTKFPMEYLERVKTVHSVGAYGSQGYRYDWKLEEAQKNLLRTHTTANSARMLYKLVKDVCIQRRSMPVALLRLKHY